MSQAGDLTVVRLWIMSAVGQSVINFKLINTNIHYLIFRQLSRRKLGQFGKSFILGKVALVAIIGGCRFPRFAVRRQRMGHPKLEKFGHLAAVSDMSNAVAFQGSCRDAKKLDGVIYGKKVSS